MCRIVNITSGNPEGWSHDIYIGYPLDGKPTKWGNQFDVAGDLYLEERARWDAECRLRPELDVNCAVFMYRLWLLNSPAGLRLQEDIDELRGKVLGCFCKPNPCHGDVLVELLGQREEMDAYR